MTDSNAQYFQYLQTRGRLAWLYRKYYLYPRLNALLRGTVADVGCGIGDFLRCRRHAVGFDVNPHAVRYCRALGLQAELMHPEAIPAPDCSFDGVMLDNVLEHLSTPDVLLQELTRIIKLHGVLIVGVPGAKGYQADPDHKRFYDESMLEAVVSKFGYVLRCTLRLPLGWRVLSGVLRQYCVYGVFVRIENI